MMSLLFTKIAICLLYLRVLSFRHARYSVYAVLGLIITANGIWTLYTVLTACLPLTAFWTPTPDAWCRPLPYWLANTGMHIGTDFLLYLIPLPVLINLRVPLRQKLSLYGVMVLGLLVCIVSVVRFWELAQQDPARMDFPYDNATVGYLTLVEINAAIACACCMTLRPLVNKWFPDLWRSSRGAVRRDVEMGGGGGALDGANRGRLTIGSTPLRKKNKTAREGLQGQLPDGDLDEAGSVTGEVKENSIRSETDRTSSTERTGSGAEDDAWTPSRPQPAHVAATRAPFENC